MMNEMKILMISPTPTHPQDAGNRARVFGLAEQFRLLGHHPFFVYCDMEDADIDLMRRYWGERLLIYPRKRPDSSWRTTLLGKLWERVNTSFGNIEIDDWCPPDLAEAVQSLHAREKFQIVWVEYVFLSKTLDAFDSSVLKVVDAHDVFSDRRRRMALHGVKPEWFSASPEQEKRGLRRADWVIAIHDRDAEAFRNIGISHTVAIGHFIENHPIQPPPLGHRILFVGSDNAINVQAWTYFRREILARIQKRLPAVSIQVAGKICRRIPDGIHFRKLGVVEDLAALYRSTTAAVNPLPWGTGLKIKTIEPLAYGCPVVTTPAGIEGIEEAENRGILVGRDPAEFAEHIEGLLTCPPFREEQVQRAKGFLRDYLCKNHERILAVLNEKEESLRKEHVK